MRKKLYVWIFDITTFFYLEIQALNENFIHITRRNELSNVQIEYKL